MICQACRQQVRLHLAVSSHAAASARAYGSRVARPSISMATNVTVSPRRRHHHSASYNHGPQLALSPNTFHTVRRAYYSSEASQPKATAAAEDAQDTSSDAASSPAPTVRLAKPDFLDEAESHIWDLLAEAFAPAELAVRDISGGCGSMYGIEISSDKFRGANMLKQQRMVNAVLGDLMKDWHGVQLKTRVP